MNLIFLTDRIWGYSAYGKVTSYIIEQIRNEHNIAHIPMSYSIRGEFKYGGNVLLFESGKSPTSEDVAAEDFYNYNADILFSIKEPWIFDTLPREAIFYIPFAIIDHDPVSPHITSKLDTAFKVISISRFAQRQLNNSGIPSHYFPHGVPTDIFKPLEDEKRQLSRKMMYLKEDEFVILMVQMNRVRKMIPHQLRGVKIFKENNPDIKFKVFLWTDIRSSKLPNMPMANTAMADYGVDLLPEIVNLNLGNEIMWPEAKLIEKGVPEWAGEDYVGGWDMVKMNNAADVLLQATGGEGAGVPYLESQACGVTPIGTDYAAAPEYVGTGITVPYKDYVCIGTPGHRTAIPDEYKIAEALEKVANGDREKSSRRARAFALRFDWKTVVDRYFKPFLEECESELYPLITKDGVSSWRKTK